VRHLLVYLFTPSHRYQMIVETIGRGADDGGGKLLLSTDSDGDIHLEVVPHPNALPLHTSVEFCTRFGGGRSPAVNLALRALREAIRQENERDPGGAVQRAGDDDFIRASGDAICGNCGQPYKRHRFDYSELCDGVPYLNVLCDGTKVKL
jgi:hypothetical protein